MSADAPVPDALQAQYERIRFIVALGTCPDCGGEVTRNPYVGDLYECLACLWRGCTGE